MNWAGLVPEGALSSPNHEAEFWVFIKSHPYRKDHVCTIVVEKSRFHQLPDSVVTDWRNPLGIIAATKTGVQLGYKVARPEIRKQFLGNELDFPSTGYEPEGREFESLRARHFPLHSQLL